MTRLALRRWLVRVGFAGLAVLAVGIVAASVVAAKVLSRPRLAAVASTTHPTLSRQDCIECHAPIAEEWRSSYHFKSITGSHWADVRALGYADTLARFRKRCVDCHAPANVLDLPHTSGTSTAPPGVECTPNLLHEPEGIIPAQRQDAVELGVDCVACHVSSRGIVGAGRRPTSEHEALGDPRFADPAVTARAFCSTCHRAAVDAWERSSYAARGVSCADCHMPRVLAPDVTGGPSRSRRSHAFVADKDLGMLQRALQATLRVDCDRKAILHLVNAGVGHYLPSGGNFLFVHLTATDTAGRLVGDSSAAIGRQEGLLLDFWPFADEDTRMPPGGERDVSLALPEGHGKVQAVVRYHDWMRINPTVHELEMGY